MGFVETVTEIARRAATGDSWYVAERPYVLEVRSPGIVGGSAVFVFPVGPQAYRVSHAYRQNVTPTLGGLVNEERGILWRDITVQGSFGLQPKTTYDTSYGPKDPPIVPNYTALSGPLWTRRMLRNVFDRYAELRADPDFGKDTYLVWHDMRTDDHWVVVPVTVDIDRNSAKRLQYPFTITLRATGDAETIPIPEPPASLLDKIKSAISKVNAALALVSSAIQEGSAILGEVRYFAATIDSVLDKVTTIVNSANDFVDGVTDTISVGRTYIASAAELLDATLALLENVADLPDDVRQNYMTALDGLDAVASELSAFGTSYESEAASHAAASGSVGGTSRAELDAAAAAGPPTTAAAMAARRTRSSDGSVIDAGATPEGRLIGRYGGFRPYVVTAADTLQGIAARLLGDGSLWYDIAIVNGLDYPYLSPSGAPGTVRPGTTISVPVLGSGTDALSVASAGRGSEPGDDVLGTDLMAVLTDGSAPGRPSVDIAVDKSTYRDARAISGVANLSQALQLRMWTERGSMPHAPNYGIRRTVGYGSTAADASALVVNVRETLLADPRVESVSNVRFAFEDDVAQVDVDVTPIGFPTSRAVSAALT